MFVYRQLPLPVFLPSHFHDRLQRSTLIFYQQFFLSAWCSGECSNQLCGNTAVACFITRQFFQHFHFCSCMAEHIHKIVNDNIDIILQHVVNIIHQFLSIMVIGDFGIGIFQICLSQAALTVL